MKLYHRMPVVETWCRRGENDVCGAPGCDGAVIGVRHGEGVRLICSRTGARVGYLYDNMAEMRREFAEFEASGVIGPNGELR